MTEQQPQPVLDYAAPATRQPRFGRGIFGWMLFIGLAVMLFVMVQKQTSGSTRIRLSDFEAELMAGHVMELTITSDGLRGLLVGSALTTPDGSTVNLFRCDGPMDADSNWAFIQWILANRNGASVAVNHSSSLLMNILVPLIPWLLIFGFIWFFVFRQLRKAAPVRQQAIPVYQVPPPVEGISQ